MNDLLYFLLSAVPVSGAGLDFGSAVLDPPLADTQEGLETLGHTPEELVLTDEQLPHFLFL